MAVLLIQLFKPIHFEPMLVSKDDGTQGAAIAHFRGTRNVATKCKAPLMKRQNSKSKQQRLSAYRLTQDGGRTDSCSR
jgi:hypothetical protein